MRKEASDLVIARILSESMIERQGDLTSLPVSHSVTHGLHRWPIHTRLDSYIRNINVVWAEVTVEQTVGAVKCDLFMWTH